MKEYTIDYTFTGKGYFKVLASSELEAQEMFLRHEVDDFVEERDYDFKENN